MTTQNSAKLIPWTSLAFGPLVIPAADITPIQIFFNVVLIATTDLYTVPAGYKALVGGLLINNTGILPNTINVKLKNSGTYYPITNPAGTVYNAGTSSALGVTYVFEAGESIAISTTSVQQLNITGNIFIIPDTYGIKSAKLLAFTGGSTPDILYTLPSGKEAIMLGVGCPFVPSLGIIQIYNTSGASRNYDLHIVPNGGSPGTTNLYKTATAVANNAVSGNVYFCPASLTTAGDTIQVSSTASTATQNCHLTLLELNA